MQVNMPLEQQDQEINSKLHASIDADDETVDFKSQILDSVGLPTDVRKLIGAKFQTSSLNSIRLHIIASVQIQILFRSVTFVTQTGDRLSLTPHQGAGFYDLSNGKNEVERVIFSLLA